MPWPRRRGGRRGPIVRRDGGYRQGSGTCVQRVLRDAPGSEAAAALRETIGYLGRDEGCRLVNSEADGLGGLIIERYGEQRGFFGFFECDDDPAAAAAPD